MFPIIMTVVSVIILFWFKEPLVKIVTDAINVVSTNLDSVNELSKAGNKIAREYTTSVDLNGLTRNYARIIAINKQRTTIGMQELTDTEIQAMGIDTQALQAALTAGQINPTGQLPTNVKP